MDYRRPDEHELRAIGDALARLQADPEHHIGGLDSEPAAIADQLLHLEPAGLDGVVAAYDDGALAGLLAAEWDDDPPRVWWNGPFVLGDRDWEAVADALYDRARSLLPASVVEQEFASDSRHRHLEAFARRHGFVEEEASAVLTRLLDDPMPPATPVSPQYAGEVTAGPLTDRDRDAVAALHEQLFPGTHLRGDRLDAGRDRLVFVAHAKPAAVVGYAAAERQDDGEGYLDFLGVDPVWRRRGIGELLVRTTCDGLREVFGCGRVHLTVRESNLAARDLYDRLGFTHERLLRPFRLGFSRG